MSSTRSSSVSVHVVAFTVHADSAVAYPRHTRSWQKVHAKALVLSVKLQMHMCETRLAVVWIDLSDAGMSVYAFGPLLSLAWLKASLAEGVTSLAVACCKAGTFNSGCFPLVSAWGHRPCQPLSQFSVFSSEGWAAGRPGCAGAAVGKC